MASTKVAPPQQPTMMDIPEPEFKTCKMNEEMALTAKDYILSGLKKYGLEKEVAEYIKRKFDKKFGPKWHCIVGRHFASHVSYEPDHYLYCKVGEEVILLFKSGGSGGIKLAS
ncbi:dynein light chain 1, cytoplasmic-like [Condylostylus longicornis]|uniref:dynein light chain 1, cytoplasmic-like n=1 Tax=Condylostylus longicornis TaxID=2530218 RepID=UPI00244E16ED|nr:dynein light chain 1, cytoplasmic-like [Condylostylus longicornis]